ncbi:MAG: bifunctional acyl-CoA synthetase/GNAT family N-acetyltransferase [Spartobacteria bacterium]|nr:bifunctional acyl-CoA synthetase/GNAT family N-acetyltransferase [Spartobacteria bacterium]
MSSEAKIADPVGDVLRYEDHPLDAIFKPKSVAVVGATEKMGSVGRTVLWNLISNPFGGVVYPVNPKRPGVMGIKAYPSISELPEVVDLAVIVTPAKSIPGIIKECADNGVKSAIVISAGFKELGAPGIKLEQEILEHARRGNMRIIGPNCLGAMNPLTGLNATFGGVMALPGNVAFISQSGALCTAILDWSVEQRVGFSSFVSIGSMVDVDWGDLIDYFGNDPRTRSIVIYMESIGNARSFLSAAREVALSKPIIVIKAGRTAAAAKAAASHTGSLTGSDDVLDAAFRRAGVLRVDNIADLFDMAEVLAKQPLPKGPNLTIVTNAGGPGVLATDALITTGGKLEDISKETIEKLNAFLPPQWSHNNPIDILGDAEPDRYAKTLQVLANDPHSDGMLVILTPQDMTDPTQTADQCIQHLQGEDKPLLASWMGGPVVKAGIDILNRANIPTYTYPDTAAKAFNYMYKYSENLGTLYETCSLESEDEDAQPDREKAAEIIARVKADGRTLFTEIESKELLAAYGIPTTPMALGTTPEEAAVAADGMGYPVVVKLHSTTITHKTDVGGVILNLKDAAAVKEAFNKIKASVAEKADVAGFEGVTVQPMVNIEGYEIILGSSIDSQFGPVMLFGMGGQLVEVFKDKALGLPPLNTNLARKMLEETKIYTALKGVRGRKSVDIQKLEAIMVRFSQMLVEQPWIKESDINPMIASPEQLLALDARVVLHDLDTREEDLPSPAIRPYPIQYIKNWAMKDGTKVKIRPISPEDESLMIAFHETLSERSVYLRYANNLNLQQRTAHERLRRVCFVDFNREMMLVACVKDKGAKNKKIIGMARLSKIHGSNNGKFSMVISDAYQGQGLGSELLNNILEVGRQEKLTKIVANILPDNAGMRALCERVGFTIKSKSGDEFVTAEITL